HHAFSSGAGRTSDGNGSHASTLKSPSYTKSVSWQHYPLKSECYYLNKYNKLHHLKQDIIDYIEYYNHHRIKEK
ncbi:IS3 family transposase, partial [Escherichia coli]